MDEHSGKVGFRLVLIGAVAFAGLLFVRAIPAWADTPVDASTVDPNALSDTQHAIASAAKKLQKANDQLISLNAEYQKISSSLSSTQKTIAETQNKIAQAKLDIERKQAELDLLEEKEAEQKVILQGLIREMYAASQSPSVTTLLDTEDFNHLLQDPNNFLSLQQRMETVLSDVQSSQVQIADQKAAVEDAKQAHQTLLDAKVQQKNALVADQQDTQSSIDDQQKVIARLKKEIGQLQDDLSSLLGQSYSAKNIQDAVEFASKMTDVPKGFLFGMLKTESNLGANVGTGSYKTDMNPDQRDTFKSLCKDLGLNPDKQPVSKRVCYNKKAKDGCGGWGGAMGAAQFIPTTWNAYASSVSSLTGNRTPNPWNLIDGVTAMAIKLSKTPGVTKGSRNALKQATCSYLGTCSASYQASVLYWADNYKQLFN